MSKMLTAKEAYEKYCEDAQNPCRQTHRLEHIFDKIRYLCHKETSLAIRDLTDLQVEALRKQGFKVEVGPFNYCFKISWNLYVKTWRNS